MNKKAQLKVANIIVILVITVLCLIVIGNFVGLSFPALAELAGGGGAGSIIGSKYVAELKPDMAFDFDGKGVNGGQGQSEDTSSQQSGQFSGECLSGPSYSR